MKFQIYGSQDPGWQKPRKLKAFRMSQFGKIVNGLWKKKHFRLRRTGRIRHRLPKEDKVW